MLDGDCGILPVVADGKLVGVVTDRDMYIALATRDKRASEMIVGEVVQTPVYSCDPDDDVQAALEMMKQHRVRRLPVEGVHGTIKGIVSMNDIVLASGPRKPVRDAEVVSTMQAICAHHHPLRTSLRRESHRNEGQDWQRAGESAAYARPSRLRWPRDRERGRSGSVLLRAAGV